MKSYGKIDLKDKNYATVALDTNRYDWLVFCLLFLGQGGWNR